MHFYHKLYTGDSRERPRMDGSPLKKISPLKASIIESPFSKEEIKGAVFGLGVFGLGEDRAPGPNGFPLTVFQHFWHLFEEHFQMFFMSSMPMELFLGSWVLLLLF